MSQWHKACDECKTDGDCQYQRNSSVEHCGEVENYDKEEDNEKNEE